MAEYNIELTAKAKQDLREIHTYITDTLKEPVAADKMLDKIEAEILTLGRMPLRHAPEKDEQLKRRNIRKLIVGNYLVFYVVQEKTATVYIVRVLHARRDWLTLL